MHTHHRIVLGDARRMRELADECVHLVVASPPYWQLKDYGEQRQIGSHGSYDDCIYNLNLGWQECFRVLREGCRLCVNIADQFVGSVDYGRDKVIPIRTEVEVLRNNWYGLHGSCHLAKGDDPQHHRWRFGDGLLLLYSQRDPEDRL